MALHYCVECGHAASSEATACPNCGRPAKPVGWKARVGFSGKALAVSIPIIAAAVSMVAGAIQYINAQRWHRAEFVAAAMKDFEAKGDVQLAMLMLDWDDRAYLLAPGATIRERVNNETLMAALTPHPEKPNGQFNETEQRVRDIFDTYFAGLEFLDAMIEARLISLDDLAPYDVKYYFDIIGKPERKERAVVEMIWRYLECYNFDGTQRLLTRYGYNVKVPKVSGCPTP